MNQMNTITRQKIKQNGGHIRSMLKSFIYIEI